MLRVWHADGNTAGKVGANAESFLIVSGAERWHSMLVNSNETNGNPRLLSFHYAGL